MGWLEALLLVAGTELSMLLMGTLSIPCPKLIGETDIVGGDTLPIKFRTFFPSSFMRTWLRDLGET